MARNCFRSPALAIAGLMFSSIVVAADANAPLETRRSLAETLRSDLARELKGQVFSGSVTRRIGEQVAGIKLSFGLTGIASGSFLDPDRNLQVEIPQLSQPDMKSLRIQTIVRCPYQGTASAKSRISSASTGFSARMTITVDAEIALSFDSNGELNAQPKIRSAIGRVTEVRLDRPIADRLLAEPLEAAVNQWMIDNPKPFLDATKIAVERGARQMNVEYRRQTDAVLTQLRSSGLTAAQEQELRKAAAQLTNDQREQILAIALKSGVTAENLATRQQEILSSLTLGQKKQLAELLKTAPESLKAAGKLDLDGIARSIEASKIVSSAGGNTSGSASDPTGAFTSEQKKATEVILKSVLKKL